MKPYITLTLLLAFALPALGTTFTVTSNADSGPGTFRDALQQAAANGSASPNQIVFNLPDLSTAGRTIILLSTLPDLSSNLTIDGTTQPGTPFGISNALVIIQNSSSLYGTYFNFFEAFGQSNIAVYGLYLQGFGAGYCLHFRQASNIQFGAAGKGNIIEGFSEPFICDLVSSTDSGSTNITIQGNIMGLDPTGTSTTIPGTYYSAINGVTFTFTNVANLQIGGLNPGEGNLIVDQSYPMNYTCTRADNFGYLNIQGNTQGTDVTGLIRLEQNHFAFEINGADNGNANVTGTTNVNINITNNLSVGGFSFFDIANPIIIQGNHLGVGPDNITNLIASSSDGNSYLLDFEFCYSALIGGPNPGNKNYIGYAGNEAGYGVFEFWCSDITISRNSFFCNGLGIEFNWMLSPRPMPFVNITLLTTGLVGGTALPGSTVELFYDDECPGCEGKTYIGTTTADNNGNWTYALVATGAIVATATDTYGATSAFSTATINTDSLVVLNATCGRNNGSIKNMQVTSGTEWYWEDANGNIVSNSTNLVNAGPGTYTFITSIGGASCSASSAPYTIGNVDLPAVNPGDITITQPTCGQANGALQDASAFNNIAAYAWLLGGNVVCPDFTTNNPYNNLAPGSYMLRVGLLQDSTCSAQYGPFTLVNQSGPTLDTSQATITPSTCGLTNGSLTNITYQNATGVVNLAWDDSAGEQVSYDLNLVNVPAGLYRLAFKDGSGCSTIFTTWYRIPNNGSISYDTSKMVITPGSCGLPDGAIAGIIATNATTFTWTAAGGQAPAANTIDITGLEAGSYQLSMTNAYGCQALTQPIIVPLIPKPAFDYSNLQTINDTCNSSQGAILDLALADPARQYTWAWFNGSQPAGNTPGYLDSLKAGTYSVTVTDSYQCSVTSEPFTIQDIELAPGAPQVSDQYIPRNTPATITVANPQKGTYELLDNPTPGATVLATSTTGVLQTPPVLQDETLFVQFNRGDCSSAISPVNIKVFDSVKLFVPNAFTPNGSANNRWRVIASGPVNSIHISVYDRYGQEVFAASSLTESWDGTTGGHPSSGTFVYLITGFDYYNRSFRLSGTVIVIR
jgi:gliding motility-associated-like protein